MVQALTEKSLPLAVRLWRYQAERFSLMKHGLLIASFSSSAVCVSALLRQDTDFPAISTLAVSFFVLLTLFFQLRIADEFKDAKEDALFRPERPVPRGLISLKELLGVAVFAAVLQSVLVFSYDPVLMVVLLIVWIYMALMTAEFFIPTWLKARPFLYMVSHMLIMPLIDFLATACDWVAKNETVPERLTWFLIISFLNGVIIELGRKTWAPSMERPGVESYSSAWGLQKSLLSWSVAVTVSLLCALVIAYHIGFLMIAAPVFIILWVTSCIAAYALWQLQNERLASQLENISGLWVFCIYLFLGLVPMVVKSWL